MLYKLYREVTDDPAGLGLAAKSDDAVAAALNAATVAVDRVIIPAREIIGATAPAEWTALTAAEKQRYQTITGAGEVDASNANVRAAFLAMFAGGTATRTALTALLTTKVSRAAQLGIGEVSPVQVWQARQEFGGAK